jgi:SulP family sulfate permease
MIESLLCGASAGKLKNEKIDVDRELFAQGIGNLIIPFFGGIPATAAIARSSVAIKSGCDTRLTGIVHAVFLLLSMFLLAPIMSAIPLSALAGVLIVTAWRMNDWVNINFIFEHKFKSGIAKFAITLIATMVLDLTQAIIIGVLFSAVLIVIRIMDIDITISEVENSRLEEIGINIPVA